MGGSMSMFDKTATLRTKFDRKSRGGDRGWPVHLAAASAGQAEPPITDRKPPVHEVAAMQMSDRWTFFVYPTKPVVIVNSPSSSNR